MNTPSIRSSTLVFRLTSDARDFLSSVIPVRTDVRCDLRPRFPLFHGVRLRFVSLRAVAIRTGANTPCGTKHAKWVDLVLFLFLMAAAEICPHADVLTPAGSSA